MATTRITGDPAPTDYPAATDWHDYFTNQSCLNGWTMGNILTTPAGLARFYHDLWTFKLIPKQQLHEMMQFQTLTSGFAQGTRYGLGQMRFGPFVGHPGEDWGSGFPIAFWTHGLNMSIVVGVNNGESPTGMNTSMTWQDNQGLSGDVGCLVLRSIFKFRGWNVSGVTCPV